MTRLLSLFTLLAVLASGLSLARPAKGGLEKISYPDLGKWVRGNKGKVVVVYFWAHY